MMLRGDVYELYNSYLSDNTKDIIDHIFSCDMHVTGRLFLSNISAGNIKGVEISFEDFINRDEIVETLDKKINRMGEDNFRSISISPSMEMMKAVYKDRLCFYMFGDLNKKLSKKTEWEIVRSICCALIGSGAPRDFAYIPAARTGLMLSYDALVSSLFETMGRQQDVDAQANFPLPTIRFLQTVSRMRENKKTRTYEIGEYIEKHIMHGTVMKDDSVKNKFMFSVDGTEIVLPMHVTSSLVTEIAPFAMYLKSGWFGEGIFFEEPEAHLHIEAQRTIARCLARLINIGVNVVITTHGDLFLQEINNLMHMHSHPRRDEIMKEFGYE
ncbi:AAA family ATPase, partial [Azospirillum sp. B506]|uniref:AAA family ATPase n=1 Tax=Azospirillum sp. B506 TaxID=137721 RepID=UPI001FCC2ECD